MTYYMVRESAGISQETGTISTSIHKGWRCFFIKEFKDLHQQLYILHKRGLNISDYKKAKQFLFTNNYYNIINGYSKFFQESTDIYIENADFNEIANLYFWDQQIKQYTFKTIIDAENHLKYTTAYYFSREHPNEEYPYLDINSYHKDKRVAAIKTASKFSDKINYFSHPKQSNNPIQHYVKKYGHVPIWVIIDYLTFGELRFFILNLPDSLKSKISKSMYSFITDHSIKIDGIFTNDILDSFLKNINELRNTCAHDSKLISFKCKASSKYYKDLHEKYKINKEDERKDFYSTLILLQCFTNRIQYNKLHNSLLKSFKNLSKKIESIDFNNILNEYGFPNNWHIETEKLPQ